PRCIGIPAHTKFTTCRAPCPDDYASSDSAGGAQYHRGDVATRRWRGLSKVRFKVDPLDIPPVVAARRLGLALEQFQEMLPDLCQRGSPAPDETTGNFCLEAVDRWRLRRFPQLFPLPCIEGPKTDCETARARIEKM